MIYENNLSYQTGLKRHDKSCDTEYWRYLLREKPVYLNHALRFSDEIFSQVFLSSPCAMFISHIKEGSLIEVNEAFCMITDRSRESLLSRDMQVIELWENDSEREQLIRQIVDNGSVNNKEVFFTGRNGKKLCALLSITILHLQNQPCLLSVMNDISEHKKDMKEFDRLAQLHLVGELAASLAHEVRNPMTTVRGFLQIMSEKQQYAMDYADIDLMISELDKANNIIGDLLFMAREKDLDFKTVELNLIIRSLEPMLLASAEVQDKSLIFELHNNPGFLMDEKEIRQLIIRLVQNALEALLPGQTLIISTYRKDGQTILCGEGTGGNAGEREMGENYEAEPFHLGNSTDLGVSLCHSIAARHHAILELKNRRQGLIFRLRFRN